MLDQTDFEQLLYSHRAVAIVGSIDEDLCARIRPQILSLGLLDDQPLRILIDSPGGGMDEGFLIYDLIRGLPVQTVGIVFGKCASMAVVVLQACTDRVALPNATFLVHSALGCVHGARTQQDYSRAFRLRREAQQRMEKLLALRTGMDPKKLRAMLQDGDDVRTEFYAEKALKLGFVDRISVQLFPPPLPSKPSA